MFWFKKKKKVGLALGSGAIRGLAHIGVLKVLVENEIPIDYIAGCSIGAWVGAHYCVYKDIEKLEKDATGSKMSKFFTFMEPSLSGGFVKGLRLHDMISQWLVGRSFANLSIPLTVIATDINTGEEVDIGSGDLTTAVRASMAIPILYRPVKMGSRYLVDGALSNPVPDNVVRRMGADVVIAVNLDNYKFSDVSGEKKNSIIGVASQAFNIMWRNMSILSMQSSDVIIKPETNLIGVASFKKFFINKIDQQVIQGGEDYANKVLPQIKKLIR
ncbi:MAG: patatin-like phospholipase family protein [Patescibacteria group bacterium]|jgi:NTE family protein